MLLVTGASGLLGANLVWEAQRLERDVAALCHQHVLRIPWTQVFSADLTDQKQTGAMVAELRPKAIIHCAAATNVDWCQDHPEKAERINVQATGFLAEAARDVGARFLYVSTDAVFDGKRGNYSETDNPSPLSIYGETKLRGEREALRSCPHGAVARVNIYGWNAQQKHSLAEWVLDQLECGNPVPGFADVFFMPLFANDLAQILLAMLENGIQGLYHVVASERVSKFEFARRLASTFGYAPDRVVATKVAEARLRAPRSPDLSLCTEKIHKALGRPMPDVESGLRHFKTLRDGGYPQQLKSYMTRA